MAHGITDTFCHHGNHHEEEEDVERRDEGRSGSSVGGVERPSLVPLHVTDPPDRLDLRHLSPEFRILLILALLKQILVPSVSGVLISHPAVSETAEETGKRLRKSASVL